MIIFIFVENILYQFINLNIYRAIEIYQTKMLTINNGLVLIPDLKTLIVFQ